MSAPSTLRWQDLCEVKEVDSSHFNNVSRVVMSSSNYSVNIQLDVNTDIYPIAINDRLNVCLATTLTLDGSQQAAYNDELYAHSLGRADDYEYVVSGKVYKQIVRQQTVTLLVSFGGLLMSIQGDPREIDAMQLQVDTSVFLLVRKS